MKTEDKLIVLMEECAEVIQAASKCVRFTWEEDYPGYGVNHEVLAREVGDLLGIIESLPLDQNLINLHKSTKMAKVEKLFEEYSC
jgi:NTP pyrophosphatase (non-canonical NTP hydrolase)